MKYLLLLFTLLSLGVKGQDSLMFHKIDYDSLYGRFGGVPLPVRLYPAPFPFPPITSEPFKHEPSPEEKLLLYAQECWNDSSKYCYWQWYNGNYIKEGVPCVCGSEYCLEKYIHRKPTFEGFLEWLKKK